MELVKTISLFKRFGKVLALRGLSLTIPRGVVAGLIGPNGAGKTTTINILAGLVKPSSGKAYVFGLDSWRDSFEIRRRMGVMAERPRYPEHVTVREYLRLAARLKGVSSPRERAEELLKEVGLARFASRRIGSLSAGMMQRLGLAYALVGDPEFVVLDEPTANLDPLGRRWLLEYVVRLHEEQGTCFLVSTHILPELERVCRWVSIVSEGRVIEQGYVGDLARKYQVREYAVTVDRPETLAQHIREQGVAEWVKVRGDTVLVRVRSFEELNSLIMELASKGLIKVRGLAPASGRLEEVFRHALGRAG